MPNFPDFNTLIDLHSSELFTYLWRMMQDIKDAEDCLQETYLRALHAYPRLSHSSNLRAWLYKIATNQAYTLLKKRNRTNRQGIDLEIELQVVDSEIEPTIERSEILVSVLEAVSSLPQKQRAALMMRKYQQLTYENIAEALNCSQESARASVYQALKKLRSQFNSEEDKYV